MAKAKIKKKERGMTPRIAQREMNSVVRESYEELGEFYHEELLPIRFTQAGGRLLKYAKRTRKYQRRKRKKFGHNNPLVYSGVSRNLALNTKNIKATATRKRAKVTVAIAARALNFRHPNSAANPSEEVKRIAPSEFNRLNRNLDGNVDRKIKERERLTK